MTSLSSKVFIRTKYFIIIETNSLESHTLVMLSENEKNVMWEGLQFFVHESKMFYRRISEMDPYKAEATMLFLEADVDGSNLLDINEIQLIFKELKIRKKKQDIANHILEINEDLYEKQNLKQPKGFTKDQLTPLGFEYLLKYYCIKDQLTTIFTEFCPLFKKKYKNTKKSIIDILKSQQKPLMSGIQLAEFMKIYLKLNYTEDQCTQMIKTFPIYDGEGKEVPEENELLSFNNFCNLIFSSFNSIVKADMMEVYQDMTHPITQYFIYTSNNTYLSGNHSNSDSKLEMYELSLKKGCRCVEIDITESKPNEFIVRHKNGNGNFIRLEDVLKTIKNVGFTFNPFPIIICIENNCKTSDSRKLLNMIEEILGDMLFNLPKDHQKLVKLPSPLKLQRKIILCSLLPKKDKKQTELDSKILLTGVKVDYERKGQYCWNNCHFRQDEVLKQEEIQNKNLTDYARKIILRCSPNVKNVDVANYDPSPMFRNGVQMIAINTQIEDRHHFYVHSKFLQNGGPKCGYLLKPFWMSGSCLESLYSTDFTKPILGLKLTVLSGQKCILVEDDDCKEFYLQVYLRGTKEEEKANKIFKSELRTEGFYTQFNLQCQFTVNCIEIATIVMNIVSNQKILAARAITVHLMQEGLHTVKLLGERMELADNSYLLVKCEKEDMEKMNRVISFN